jgi:hypothetical protein
MAVAITVSLFGTLSVAEEETEKKEPKRIKVGAGELGIEAEIIEGSPIRSDQVLTEGHPKYARGMVCAECHEVTFDMATTSTKQFMMNFPLLTREEVWKKIIAFLPGRERFALTTSFSNQPMATTVDMTLDPEEKVFYVICEKGTEKLFHVKENPWVSAVRFKGWTVAEGGKLFWKSVQVKGNAEIVTSDSPKFVEYLERYKLVRLKKERAIRRMDLLRITPTRIVYFDTDLPKENYGIYQVWERE